MLLTDSKSNLAKLMATENLTVEQRNVRTAYFDVKNRVLVVPTLDGKLSSNLYDLLLGHEVGHALETPEEGLHDSIYNLKVNRSILNVCEDIRIEKKIKRRYPGIRNSFIKGYSELMARDFFGVNGTNLNMLNFIDRLNLHTKGGVSQGIKFSEEEMPYVAEAEATETFEETVEIARKIQEFMAESAKKNKQKSKDDSDEDDFDLTEDSGDNDDDTSESFESGDNNDNFETTPSDALDDTDNEIIEEDESDMMGAGDLSSHTDNVFRRREQELYENSKFEIEYANIPKLNLDRVVVPYKTLYKEIHQFNKENEVSTEKMTAYYNKFRNSSSKIVSYLAKEFELRKNADQLKRASVAKTGELNMNKIYSYKLAEDIFKRMSVVPAGKSHGLVMCVDWSGSMSGYMENTIKQLLNLVMFCKKVCIPFEVYAFHSADFYQYFSTGKHKESFYQIIKRGDLRVNNFSMLNILSSKMSNSEFTFASKYLLATGNRFDYSYKNSKDQQFLHSLPDWFELSGTPLNEAIVSSMEIVPKFQKENKLQIVNTVFLTDGEGGVLCEVINDVRPDGRWDTKSHYPNTYSKRLIVRDPITRASEEMSSDRSKSSNAFLKLLKQRTQSNVIGFFVAPMRAAREALRVMSVPGYNVDVAMADFRKNNHIVVTTSGYDEYYILKSDKLDTDEDTEFNVTTNTTRGLVTAFKKYNVNKINNRVVLNRFIGLIA